MADNSTDAQTGQSDFERLAAEGAPSLPMQLLGFLGRNKKWWLLPIILVLLLIGLMLLLTGGAAAPFIYTLF